MKHNVFAWLIVFFLPFLATAQECSFYYPQMEGARIVYQHYDKKSKPSSKSVHEVLAYKGSGNGAEAIIKVETYDDKDKLLNESTLEVKCEAGIFYIDMESFLSPQLMTAYYDMDLIVTTDNLEMPDHLNPGDKLKDGSLTIDIITNGFKIMTVTILISDRIVEGEESVTTAAGTFSCYKIDQKVTSRFGLTVVSNSIEWYSKNVGLIKSVSYSTDSKLAGQTELIELKR